MKTILYQYTCDDCNASHTSEENDLPTEWERVNPSGYNVQPIDFCPECTTGKVRKMLERAGVG